MTPSDLRALGAARYGADWQSPLARAIGISPRHMRRLAAGSTPVTPGIERDILRVLGGTDLADPDWPRDAWIVGDGRDDLGNIREYVVHARRPRFVARVVALDDTEQPTPSEEPADITTGIVYTSGDYVLAELVWLDPPPPLADIHRLLEAACDAVDASVEG